MSALTFLSGILTPITTFDKHIKMPFVRMVHAIIDHYKKKANEGITSFKDILLRGGILALATATIIWISIFLYVVFYYTYMPSMSHMRPVNLQFKSCETEKGACTFPSAHVSLTKRQQLLMTGQPYKIYLYLEMPESNANKKLGMFMVCAEMRDKSSILRGHACRSSMLHYRSELLQAITTIAMSPFLVFGFNEEKQLVPVELFSSYEEDQNHPVTDVYLEVQSKSIELYSAHITITAHFTGLRYIMFHWPILSASIGVTTNLFFIAFVCVLSWYHLSDTEWLEKTSQKAITKIKRTAPRFHSKAESLPVDDSSSLDDASLVEELKVSPKPDPPGSLSEFSLTSSVEE